LLTYPEADLDYYF